MVVVNPHFGLEFRRHRPGFQAEDRINRAGWVVDAPVKKDRYDGARDPTIGLELQYIARLIPYEFDYAPSIKRPVSPILRLPPIV